MRGQELELYVHIPFCVQKCKYCDFLSAPASKQVQNAYMEALLKEIREKSEGRYLPGNLKVTSVFIGGGTPSVVDAEWIGRLMQVIGECFSLEPDAEISMEVNPGTVTGESLALYRRAGINRLSIGCQSTDDGELERIGRIHTFAQFLDTYRWARKAGFDNINVDLMNALPGQTLADAERNLERILALDPAPEHVSVYSLIVEEKTSFYEMYERGELELPDEDLEREIYWRTAGILKKHGYEHYEISNFAREGYRCRHNCGYWKRQEYLGFGIGAASLYGEVRFTNMRDLGKYLECMRTEPDAELPAETVAELNPDELMEKMSEENSGILSEADRMAETMFLGLRMSDGVDKELFEQQFGEPIEKIYGKEIAESVEEGLLEERAGRLILTKRGIDVSNYVMAKFLAESEEM